MYGAGHMFKGQTNFYLHESSCRTSPTDADFGQALETSISLTSLYIPPLAIAEALQDNVSHSAEWSLDVAGRKRASQMPQVRLWLCSRPLRISLLPALALSGSWRVLVGGYHDQWLHQALFRKLFATLEAPSLLWCLLAWRKGQSETGRNCPVRVDGCRANEWSATHSCCSPSNAMGPACGTKNSTPCAYCKERSSPSWRHCTWARWIGASH